MTEYVTFKCGHFAQADGIGEEHAIAYADIDGFPAEEDGMGTVICRIWLLKGADGKGHPRFLIDWHLNAYRTNTNVLELIHYTKADLEGYKDALCTKLFNRAYSKYQLDWMSRRGYTLDMLMAGVQEQLDEEDTDVAAAFSQFVDDSGFSGSMWACRQEFGECEWKDREYMSVLLCKDDFELWEACYGQ